MQRTHTIPVKSSEAEMDGNAYFYAMATALKDLYNDPFFDFFIASFQGVYPALDGKKFKKEVYAGNWPRLELKERMRRSADVLAKHLPPDYTDAAPYLQAYATHWYTLPGRGFSFELLFLCDYVERYGLHDVETSIQTMEKLTTVSSAEFAVRPFLNKYPERMIPQMHAWSKHPRELVRRLSTEGFRPRLPWGLAVPYLKKDPTPIWPVLEALKTDASETVRRSVANNLNDISKEHPQQVLERLTRWKKEYPQTEKLVKHASRTLLKQGHPQVLELFGAGTSEHLTFAQEGSLTPKVQVGEPQTFAFHVSHTGKKKDEQKLRLEYLIYYRLKNGQYGKKVFFLSEKNITNGQTLRIQKTHTFRPITTRTYYGGTHKMAILLNGKEYELGEFELVV